MKILKRDKAALCLAILVIAAALLRLILISNNWPTTNSDEATIDLMALHILTHGEHPIFFYGQPYMGSFEAYLGALCFWLLGVSLFSLRLGLLLLLIGFLISIYFLTALLYSKRFALFVVALLGLGSSDSILHQFKAIGGYPETLLLGTLIFLLSSQLVLSRQTNPRADKRRTWRYALLGLLIGFSLYTDPLDAPLIAASLLLLGVFCWRELFSPRGVLLVLMIVTGLSPLIIYNLQLTHGMTTLDFYLFMQQIGNQEMLQLHLPAIQKLVGALLITLPLALGITPACSIPVMPFFGPAQASTLVCVIWHGGWSLGYWSLWTLATVLAMQILWRIWRKKRRTACLLADAQFAKTAINLMLLLSTALSFLLYSINPESALAPAPTTRYLICMLIGAPALLWPLWQPLERVIYQRVDGDEFRLLKGALCAFLLLLIGIATTSSTIAAFGNLKSTAEFYRQQDSLIAWLTQHHDTRIYSDYWTCNLLIFRSDEHILCSSLDGQLRPAEDRYPPYRMAVRAATDPAYVFHLYSPQAKKLAWLLHKRRIDYQQFMSSGYIIYQVGQHIQLR